VGQTASPGSYWTPDEQRRVREELERMRRASRLPVDDRLSIVVLDIDGDTGDLLLTQGADLLRLTPGNVDELIQRHQSAARALDKELFYLLRVPRPGPEGVKAHPSLADERRYRDWFRKHRVEYRIDYPKLPD
jgi:hypothetical protein